MKKKILVLFVLLVAVFSLSIAFAISAGASGATECTVSIDRFNLVFEDNVYLKYAVKFGGIADEDIKNESIGMLYYTEPQDVYTEANAKFSSETKGHTTIQGTKYYTFEYRKLTAQQMTDYVYSVAYIDFEGVRYYSAPVKYSVLDYVYIKTAKIGDSASTDPAFIEMLESMLVYGANAQKYFKHNLDRLADDEYYQVAVVGGVLEDGYTEGLYHTGESATLTAPETKGDLVFDGWANSLGQIVSTKSTFTLNEFTKNETYTALYDDIYSDGLVFTSNKDGTCFVSGIGSCTDTDILIAPNSPAGDKVTGIGAEAFMGNTEITSIVMPDSVTSIGDTAFYGCTNLTAIEIPNGVTSIGTNTFAECTSLTSIVIPDNTTTIGMYAFYGCTKLASVTFGDSVTSIGYGAFYKCQSLTIVELPDGLETIGDSAFGACSKLASVVIPAGVENISFAAFDKCSNLLSVYYEGTESDWALITIGEYNEFLIDATRYYYSATKPQDEGNYWRYVDGAISIWKATLEYTSNGDGTCYVSGIGDYVVADVVIPSRSPENETVVSIGAQAFIDCDNITSIVIPSGITSIGNHAFSGCTSLTSVYYNGTESGWNAVTIGNNNTAITGATRYYYSATEPTVVGNFWYYLNDVVTVWPEFYSKGLTFTSNGDGTCYIEDDGSCTDAVIVIPSKSPKGDRVTAIGANAFQGNSTVTTIIIPAGITSIGQDAFWNCTNLVNIDVANNNANYKSVDGNLYSADGKTLIQYTIGKDAEIFIIDDSVTVIGRRAFQACSSLTSIVIGKSVTSIEFCAFYNCQNLANVYYKGSASSWLNVSVNANAGLPTANPYCYSEGAPTVAGNFWHYVNGVVTVWPGLLEYTSNGDGTCYVSGIGSCTDTVITIPSTSPYGDAVTGIADEAFKDNTNITSVIIPDGVTYIGNNAFSGCTSLASVVIPNGVTSIGENAFRNCDGLTSIVIPDSVTEIASMAFANCDNLESVVIGSGITVIAEYTFYNCKNLAEITVPAGLKTIEAYAFYSCNSLARIYYKGTVSDWFNVKVSTSNNGSITTAIRYFYSASEPTVNGYFWRYVGDIATAWPVSFSEGLTFASNGDGTYSVSGAGTCTDTEIIIPDVSPLGYPVTGISASAFQGNATITSVVIPAGVTSIGANAFYNCSKLANIEVANGNTNYKSIDGSLYSADGKTLIQYAIGKDADCFVMPEGVTTIGASALRNCTSITSIVVPDSVTSIETFAFYGCNNITSVYYMGTSTDWSGITIGSNNDTVKNATRYFYSEKEPTTEGKFWHYDNGVITAWPEIASRYSEGLTFVSNGNGTCSVKYGSCTDTVVIIPPTSPSGDTVTSIASNAFYSKTQITHIEIPDTVTTINGSAFYGCSKLTSIVIPAGVTSIGNSAFNYSAITTVYYKGTTASWSSITVGSSNTKLTGATLYFYSENAPKTEGNFWHYDAGEVTVWPEYVPPYSEGLKFTSNGDGTCYVSGVGTCTDTIIYVPKTSPDGDTVTEIGTDAFKQSSSNRTIEQVIIPNTVTKIQGYAFRNCTVLTTVTIPDSVTEIGSYAFYNCSKLETVIIGDGKIDMKDNAFYNCNNINAIYFEGTEKTWSNITKRNNIILYTTEVIYYYSEEEPTTSGYFWHYVDGVATKW